MNKVHTGAAMSAPYLSQHTDIDSEGRKKEEYDKKDDLNFLIVNFPFRKI